MADIIIAAIGKLKREEEALVNRYLGRCRWKIQHSQLAEQASAIKEGEALGKAVKNCNFLVALDERGANWNSTQFANKMSNIFDRGQKPVAFVIGGADGLDPALRQRADLVLSFSAMTWPHQLVRVLLAEQIYRAQTLIAGHPYHKA